MPLQKNVLLKIHKRAREIKTKNKNMPYKEAFGIATDQIKKGVAKKNIPVKRIYQTDEMKKAKPLGKRKSRSGVTYYERRKNRSDMPGSLTGISNSKIIGEIKERIKGTIGKAYANLIECKTKKDKQYYNKIILENKKKLKKLS